MDIEITPIDVIKDSIKNKMSFVLEGGAGSGKTETLKQVLEFLSNQYPEKKAACITHTNSAASEISSRVGTNHVISTIHSFLNSHIKDFKKNIHSVMPEVFQIEELVREELDSYEDEKVQKKKEYEKYKRIYERFAKKKYTVKNEPSTKVIGKREYDKSPIEFNIELNDHIKNLNAEISTIISSKSFSNIKYNETRFDNFEHLTYGHDSLLKIAHLLVEKFPLLGKIISDKFDFIFIDEYQDTNKLIIDFFLNNLLSENKIIIGLFGDSMQGIYDDGAGNVNDYINQGVIKKIIKKDNYRSSLQVVQFINKIRNDEIEQEVALKKDEKSIQERQGKVKLYYSQYYKPKPHSRSLIEEKDEYINALIKLVDIVEGDNKNFQKLMLTNKSISIEVEFKYLYEIYSDRYLEVNEEVERDLERLHFLDLAKLCVFYEKKEYNHVLTELKRAGFLFKNSTDKNKVKELFDQIMKNDLSAYKTLIFAFENNLIRKSEYFNSYMHRKDSFIQELQKDQVFLEFKRLYNDGYNTFSRMSKVKDNLIKEEFDESLKLLKKEKFSNELFSERLKFNEILSYYRYLNEDESYITMHKTKRLRY